MSFAEYLAKLDAIEAPSALCGKFLEYRELRQVLQPCLQSAAPPRVAVDSCTLENNEAENVFISLLEGNVKAVSKQFCKVSIQVIRRYDELRSNSCWRRAVLRRKAPSHAELLDAALWCRRYACLNALALNKLIKLLGHCCRSGRGRRCLQACWSGASIECVHFLHSPLFVELKAVEAMLAEDAGKGRSSIGGAMQLASAPLLPAPPISTAGLAESTSLDSGAATVVPASDPPAADGIVCASGNTAESTALLVERELSGIAEEDLTCTICLDHLYRPIGLMCGHRFCIDCLFDALHMHVERSYVAWLLGCVPPTRSCPECRQRRVFRAGMELKHLDAIIKARYPAEWAQRDQKHKKLEDERKNRRYTLPVNRRVHVVCTAG